MRLVKAQIFNYRSIKNIIVEFDPACRVLVGINESGKSNILNALSLLSDDYSPSRKDDVREGLPNEEEIKVSYVKFFFRLDKSESEEVLERVSEKILSSAKDPEIVLVDGKASSLRSLCNSQNDARYHVNLIKENKGFRYPQLPDSISLNGNWKKPSQSCPADFEVTVKDQKYKLAEQKLIRVSDCAEEVPESYLEDASQEDLGSLIGGHLIDVASEFVPDALFWEYDENNLLPSQVVIDSFASDPNLCTPLKNMFTLAGIDNIQEEINYKKSLSNNQFQNFLDRVAAKTTEHFRSVWHEYKDIEFCLRLESDKIIPAVKEKNSFDFQKRSDGFKRFVTFLLMISVNVKTDNLNDTLLLIDEPDISLHPSGARYLRNELIRISAKNQVVYSTHSIFMIDAGDIGRHYLVRKKDEITSIEQAKDSNIADEEVIFNALGFSVFEIINSKNLIFEGWKDKKLFAVARDAAAASLKKKLEDVGVCHAKGVKHIKALTPMMELASRECLIISDSDKPAKEQKKQYKKIKGYGEWKIYQDINPEISAVTGEDFIKNTFIVGRVNSAIEDFGLPEFPEDVLSDAGKLDSIDDWLRENGLTQEQASQTVTKVKESLFEDLRARDIDDSYQVLLRGIADLISEDE